MCTLWGTLACCGTHLCQQSSKWKLNSAAQTSELSPEASDTFHKAQCFTFSTLTTVDNKLRFGLACHWVALLPDGASIGASSGRQQQQHCFNTSRRLVKTDSSSVAINGSYSGAIGDIKHLAAVAYSNCHLTAHHMHQNQAALHVSSPQWQQASQTVQYRTVAADTGSYVTSLWLHRRILRLVKVIWL